MKRLTFIFMAMMIGAFMAAAIAQADIVHLKSGKSLSGEIEETPDGVWIEGVLFGHDEISKIEKSNSSTNKGSWLANLFPKKEPEPTNAKVHDVSSKNIVPPPQAKPKKSNKPVNALQLLMQGAPSSGPDYTTQAADSYGNYMSNASGAMEKAQMLQQQAHQRQMMIMREMRCVEYGECGDTGPSVAPKVIKEDVRSSKRKKIKKSSYDDDYDEYEDMRSYKKRSYKNSGPKSRLRKGINIDRDGNVNFE